MRSDETVAMDSVLFLQLWELAVCRVLPHQIAVCLVLLHLHRI